MKTKIQRKIGYMSNSSSWLRKFYASGSRWVFEAKCGFFYMKQPISHLDQDSRENGSLWWKNENPCFEKFLRGLGPKITLKRRWRVTSISGGETLKISKWFSYHDLSQSQAFQNYLQFPNRMSRNQDIQFWRYRAGSWKVTVSRPENLKMGLF